MSEIGRLMLNSTANWGGIVETCNSSVSLFIWACHSSMVLTAVDNLWHSSWPWFITATIAILSHSHATCSKVQECPSGPSPSLQLALHQDTYSMYFAAWFKLGPQNIYCSVASKGQKHPTVSGQADLDPFLTLRGSVTSLVILYHQQQQTEGWYIRHPSKWHFALFLLSFLSQFGSDLSQYMWFMFSWHF